MFEVYCVKGINHYMESVCTLDFLGGKYIVIGEV